jgi:monoamine oxidase
MVLYDVLIIGAGAAGLAAAGVLEREGIRAVILEARERIGGRIHTIHPSSCAVPVELGAEFVHGRPPEIWPEVTSGRLSAEEVKGDRFYFEDGRLRRLESNDAVDQVLQAMRDYTDPDRSFEQFLAEACRDVPETEKARASAYVEGFNAARKEDVSVRSLVMGEEAAAQAGGGRMYRFGSGYDSVIGLLWASCARSELRLGNVVESLLWQRGSVTAKCASGTYSAKCAVVTLPLGVLQSRAGEPGYVEFDPEVGDIRNAASQLCMGQALRVTFEFRHRFWDWGVPTFKGRTQDLSMLFSLDPGFPTWWTSEPVKAPVITGWASGTRVREESSKSPEQITRDAAASLARLFGVPAEKVQAEIVTSYLHDWQADRFARGAYSYVPVGAVDNLSRLGLPVEDTLFFAGEATHNAGRNGTVDGAIATGRRAANDVLRVLRR